MDIEQYDERARVSAQMAEVAKQIAESDPTAEGMDEATSLLQQVNTLKQYAQVRGTFVLKQFATDGNQFLTLPTDDKARNAQLQAICRAKS